MHVSAKITGIKYTPFLCRKLNIYSIDELDRALSKESTFILEIDNKEQLVLSWWVSAKRTRSYPYARVYDSLSFPGKKATIIPIFKDEGFEGDRDFLQWDTVSLMSLLGVYVIISYYVSASSSSRYRNKITNQKFDVGYIKNEIKKLLSYQSDALHWNLSQLDKVGELGRKALNSYAKISKELKVKMHSASSAQKRIEELLEGKEKFMTLSRTLAENAQKRERVTIQPKEKLAGTKATITIKNYLGGYYFFTADEVEIKKDEIKLIESKYTKQAKLPSIGDIKDGLLKMILFTNLENVRIDKNIYFPVPILKLTTEQDFKVSELSKKQAETLKLLEKEAEINGFELFIKKA